MCQDSLEDYQKRKANGEATNPALETILDNELQVSTERVSTLEKRKLELAPASMARLGQDHEDAKDAA